MLLKFPSNFVFGTSTAAYQIETAVDHDWLGYKSKDGYVFETTSDHEKRLKEDAAIIAHCGGMYRMSLQWSKIQRKPFAELEPEIVAEYKAFLDDLKSRGVSIMMVLHHFTNPTWFAKAGGWEEEKNTAMWVDFCKKVEYHFGDYIAYWNTFNEPNVYVSNGWVLGEFPPFKKNLLKARRAIHNIWKAHNEVYDYLKAKRPAQPIGISHNCVAFTAENIWGVLPAKISDWWFMDYLLKGFTDKLDFFGLSYYARISHDPLPITYLDTPEKFVKYNKPHDGMWEYYPLGMREGIERYWKKYKLPVFITESGICTNDDSERISAMKDYVKIVYDCLQAGIPMLGYLWWSTFDNFEWNLGPTFRFGLYETDLTNRNRIKRPSADVFHQLAYEKQMDV